MGEVQLRDSGQGEGTGEPVFKQSPENVFEREMEIVWIDSPRLHRYVRERVIECNSRARKPARSDYPGHLVAYATLRPDARSMLPGIFQRRAWWVASHDPYPGAGHPMEAVDPLSIRAGRRSRYPRESREAAGSDAPDLPVVAAATLSPV